MEERNPKPGSQLLGSGRGAVDEDHLRRRVAAQLIVDGLDRILVTHPSARGDPGLGE